MVILRVGQKSFRYFVCFGDSSIFGFENSYSFKWYEQAAYYHNAQFGMPDENIPTRGQGKKKTDDEEFALWLSEYIFKDLAKNGELNLPLGNIYEILSKFLVRLNVFP